MASRTDLVIGVLKSASQAVGNFPATQSRSSAAGLTSCTCRITVSSSLTHFVERREPVSVETRFGKTSCGAFEVLPRPTAIHQTRGVCGAQARVFGVGFDLSPCTQNPVEFSTPTRRIFSRHRGRRCDRRLKRGSDGRNPYRSPSAFPETFLWSSCEPSFLRPTVRVRCQESGAAPLSNCSGALRQGMLGRCGWGSDTRRRVNFYPPHAFHLRNEEPACAV
jgi:hypothetical protein